MCPLCRNEPSLLRFPYEEAFIISVFFWKALGGCVCLPVIKCPLITSVGLSLQSHFPHGCHKGMKRISYPNGSHVGPQVSDGVVTILAQTSLLLPPDRGARAGATCNRLTFSSSENGTGGGILPPIFHPSPQNTPRSRRQDAGALAMGWPSLAGAKSSGSEDMDSSLMPSHFPKPRRSDRDSRGCRGPS